MAEKLDFQEQKEILENKENSTMATKSSARKTINIPYQGRDYILEFDFDSVKSLSTQGFNVDEAMKFPALQLPLLFFGAFRKHHRYMPRKMTDEILEQMKDKSSLWEVLFEMYSTELSGLFGGDEDDDEKKIRWTVN